MTTTTPSEGQVSDTKQELKPCPFCGCETIKISGSTNKNGNKNRGYAKCMRCYARGPKDFLCAAFPVWNTRSHADSKNVERQRQSTERVQEKYPTVGVSSWWSTEPNVGRVANGIPFRVDRLRGLGNAVVPQQARKAFEELSGLNLYNQPSAKEE